jgi:hypothetical protein
VAASHLVSGYYPLLFFASLEKSLNVYNLSLLSLASTADDFPQAL